MAQTSRKALQPLDRPGRWISGLLGLGAALATILASAHSCGLIGDQSTRLSLANLAVSWVGLSPGADTARALGDTVRFVASVTDRRGTALVGAAIDWKTDDPAIAVVDSAGFVVARAPGATIVTATVANKTARARIVVRPRVARLLLGDAVVRIPEGGAVAVALRALDARGHPVPAARPRLGVSDSVLASAAAPDSVWGLAAGRTTIFAELDGVRDSVVAEIFPVPGRVVLVRGADQSGGVDSRLAEPVAVRVDSRKGRPMPGLAVRFVPGDGAGIARPDSAVTDADGLAAVTWVTGDRPGRQRLVASVAGVDTVAVAYAEIDPSRANTRVAAVGDAPSGLAGDAQPVTVNIQLTDTLGRVLPGVPVAWRALDGGTISARDARSDSVGGASAAWWLGPKAGVQRAQVLVGSGRSVPPATVIAAAFPGAPAALTALGPTQLTGTAGTGLSRPVVVRVTDRHGNPVPGVAVGVSAPGTVSDSFAATDSTGRTTIHWTLGQKAGSQALVLRTDGVPPLRLAATVRPKPAANVAFLDPPAAGHAGRSLGKGVRARVTDVYGNAVAGVLVSFTASQGSIRPARVATGSNGVATTVWTLGRTAGRQRLAASLRKGGPGDAMEVEVAARR